MEFTEKRCPRLLKLYTRERWLGKGGEGVVYQVRNRATRERFAGKMYSEERRALREERIMMKLQDCPGTAQIVRLVKEKEGGSCYGTLIMQLYGNNLRQNSNSILYEKDVAVIVRKLAETLQLIHARGVVHCDLKLENVFFELRAKKMSAVVIGDFGLATDDLKSFRGSLEYMAPEVYCLREPQGIPSKFKCTDAVDIWGLGIIAYQLLGVTLDIHAVRDRGEIYWPAGLSGNAKDLVSSMLVRDPEKRFTLEDVLKHQWIVEHTRTTVPSIERHMKKLSI